MTEYLRAPDPELVNQLRVLGVNIGVYAPEANDPDNLQAVLDFEETGTHPWDRLDDRGAVQTTIPSSWLPADFYSSLAFNDVGEFTGSGFAITIGLPYKASFETLPIVSREGRRSNVTSAMFMCGRHENFCVGRVDALAKVRYGRYFYEGLQDTIVNRPVQNVPTFHYVPLPPGWDYAGSIFAEAQIGQPLEVLQIVLHDQSGDAIREDIGGSGGGSAGSATQDAGVVQSG